MISLITKTTIPENPLLAEPMYYKGYSEKGGTETGDIVEKCLAYGLAKPEYQQDEDFRVVIYRLETAASDQVSNQVIKVLSQCKNAATLAQIGEVLMMRSRVYIKRKYVNPLIESALLEMTIPDKPTSSQQKYRITAKGLELLAWNSEQTIN